MRALRQFALRGVSGSAAVLILCTWPTWAQAPLPERAALPAASEATDIPDPGETKAAKARAVLDRHCSRCHEAGRLQRLLPAAGIANILDLEAIAGRRDLVRPGYPDASSLFTSVFSRHMPYDVFHELAPGAEPSPAEITELRSWIESLPAVPACQPSTLTDKAIAGLVERDLHGQPAQVVRGRRYLSIANLVSTCDDREVLDAYRQASTKLINLLSRAPEPVHLKPVGLEGVLFSFDLGEIGWSIDQWNWLAARNQVSRSGDDGAIRPATRHALRADWLAHQAIDPSVYAKLVGLPKSLPDLVSALGTDQQATGRRQAYRLDRSQATGTARIISRFQTPARHPVWTAQDLAGAVDDSGSGAASQILQTRVIVQLPNGFPGFGLYHRDGTPRVNAHKSTVPAPVGQAAAASAGLNCLACHGDGLEPFEAEPNSENPLPGGWQVRRDNQAFHLAMRALGIPAGLKIDGFEPVIALAERYGRDLGLREAAAEIALSPDELQRALYAVEGDMQPVARLLLQDLVTRAEFENLRSHLEASDDKQDQTSLHRHSATSDAGLRLSLWTDKSGYRKGDEVVVRAATTASCRLTLISVDRNGEAVAIFPSEYQDDNLIEPGTTRSIPTPSSGYRLRVDEPGREAIIGICLAGDRKSPPGIVHDYELQPFTLLGNWTDHMGHALEADAAERRNAGQQQKRKRRRRGRRVKLPPSRANKLPLPQDWAMIVIPAHKAEVSATSGANAE